MGKGKKAGAQRKSGGSVLGTLVIASLEVLLLLLLLLVVSVVYIYFNPYAGSPEHLPVSHYYYDDPVKDQAFRERVASFRYVKKVGLNVVEAGPESGEMVVLLHGFPETAVLSFHAQIEFLAKEGYFVVAPDQRGYNTSMKPESVSEYSLAHLTKDIVDLMDSYGRSTVHLAAHDWGAAVAWQLANDYPDRFHSMTIINVPHPKVMERTLQSSWTQLSNSWYIFFFQVPLVPEMKMEKENYLWLSRAFTMSPPKTFTYGMIDEYKKAWAQPGALSGMINWYRSAIRNILFAKKPPSTKIQVPTQVLWGDRDIALDASMASLSVEMCEDGKLIMLPGVSHWVTHEVPDRVNTELLSFIRAH